VLATLSVIVFSVKFQSLYVLCVYVFLILIGVLVVRMLNRYASSLYLGVYCFAIFFAVINYFYLDGVYGMPYFNGGSDGLMYDTYALQYLERYNALEYWSFRETPLGRAHNSPGYVYIVAMLHSLGDFFLGYSPLVPRLLNAMCLGILAVYVHTIALSLGIKERVALVCGGFAGFLPLMVWASSHTFRDVVQALLIVIFFDIWRRYINNEARSGLLIRLLISILLITSIWELRAGQALVSIFFLLYAVYVRSDWVKRKKTMIVTVLATGVIYYALAEYFGDLVHVSEKALNSYENINRSKIEVLGGGLSSIVFNSSLLPFGWLYRIAYALVSPLPVSYGDPIIAYLSFGTIIHIFFLPYLFYGIYYLLKKNVAQEVLVFWVMLFFGMAMLSFQGRHMVQFLPFAILLAGVGWENYPLSRIWSFFFVCVIGLILFGVYLLLSN